MAINITFIKINQQNHFANPVIIIFHKKKKAELDSAFEIEG